MCDLIDLNSSDTKNLLSSKLASPLIPVPKDTLYNNYNVRSNEPSSLATGKRDSLENNPFDMVLHKTTEYIQKQEDPFEVILEKALEVNCEKNTPQRKGSLDLTDNYSPKRKMHRQKLRLNKTLSELITNDKLNQNNAANKISNESITDDLNDANILNTDIKSHIVVPTIEIEDANLSILNQSVMNDTLLEAGKESSQNQIKSTSQSTMLIDTHKDTKDISLSTFNVQKVRRSLSQGEVILPRKSQYLNQMSLVEPLRIGSDSGSNISTSNSLKVLNEGFLKTYSSESSVFSNLSNISSIPKLNSVSSTINSSMTTNGTMNRTFLDSCSLEKAETTKLSENVDFNNEMKSVLPTTKTSVSLVGNTSIKSSISDLTERLNKLKMKVLEIHIPENSDVGNKDEHKCNVLNNVKECETIIEKIDECDVNDKLIDVDVFTPDANCSKENCTNSTSDTSSDSVFVEGNKINKSIFQEAKLLARTFEELAMKTSSGSSIDDLITNNSSWTLELLPAFDDEASVENLIELPTSPYGNDTKSKSEKTTEQKDNESHTNKREISNRVEEKIKDLEMEFVHPVSAEKRLTAATLLLDLKQLIKTEKNIEADKLVENLEKALGVNCDNNTELLTACLNATNNLAKSPQKSSSGLEIIKNVAESNMEHSQEDNLDGDSTESIKESVFFESINFNDVNTNKCTNNQKYLNSVSEINVEKIERKRDENKFNGEKISKENSVSKSENNTLLNERMIIELLTNIGKLLSEQTEEHSSRNILNNLGKALNSASNNYDIDKDVASNNAFIEIEKTPKKSKLKFENKIRSLTQLKSDSRLSLELKSKKQPASKNFIRRSVSVSQTPPIKHEPRSSISTSKNASQLKEATKRFPSDPGLTSSTLNKQVIIKNNKNELQKGAQTKTITTLDLQKEKTSTINTVKNKLKAKIGSDVINKKGPLKAILPIGNMQKRETSSNKATLPVGTITPPHTHKIISSTPNTANELAKKSRSSKPVASSTPDAQSCKTRPVQSQVANSPKKRNFSCDISPVTTRVNISNNNGTSNSPRRHSKLPSPKRTTPKRRPTTESGIPKSQTPPINKRMHSSFEVNNQYERAYVSPQRSIYKTPNSQKNSPISLKTSGNNTQQSPLRDSNKIIPKVKPINLISKLRRHSIGTNVMEKENNYV
ncbi:uncharacterized protein LOC143425209 [Xylocopa sonorina]|uniref:uncharacterized protein LOC143425209 n=1 Tax=Xylocopa sonorina TaxID=1818115 RepID=UPI00403AD1DA